ncbi:hypothetical protein EV426DRAFT_721146 [Tirmania nivea]|nr:hypothetical protein EV426DRAFT_721146 [Tirmania nivea]
MASISVQDLELRSKAALSSYQTALAILLPPSSTYHRDISTLRSLYDRNSEIWPPHLNILYPFVPPASLPTAVDAIQKYLADRFHSEAVTPLSVKLDTAGIWKHKDHATIYLGSSLPGKLEVLGLREGLLNLFSSPAKDEAREYTPHLTIGQTAVNEDVMMGLLGKAQKLIANAGSDGIQWNPSRLVVLQKGDTNSRMQIVSEIILGRQYACESPDSEHYLTQKSGSHYAYVCLAAGRQGAYVPYTPGKRNPLDVQTLTLATYNIFAESAIPTAIAKSRYPLLLSAILSTTASVLTLQEVTDDFLVYLLSQSEIQRRFPYSTHSPSHGILPSWRNCVTLASYPLGNEDGTWEFVELGRHKGAVVVELNLGEKRLVIANVHLTCGTSDGSSAARVTQLRILSSYFLNRKVAKDSTEIWVICGDFNIPTSHSTIKTAYTSQEISQETYKLLLNTDGDGKRVIPDMWKDTYTLTHSLNGIADIADLKFDISNAHDSVGGEFSLLCQPGATSIQSDLALGPGEFGATFNPFTNRLGAESVKCGANPRPQRYDRILVSRSAVGAEQNWMEVKNTGRFGLEGGSDHWGLNAEIRVRNSTTDMKGTRKTCLKLESRLQAKGDMTDEALEKYLSDSGMIPSWKDYSIRDEAKGVLTMILASGSEKHHERQAMPPVHNVEPTRMNGESTDPLSQPQRLALTEKPQVNIIIQVVGSYFMNLFTPNSDVDILCASNISARVFWVLAKQKIRRHNRMLTEAGGRAGRIRILRIVEAQSGTMMELEYIGGFVSSKVQKPEDKETADIHKDECANYRVRIDLQYCQVPERVLASWNQLPYLSPSDPIFSLPATALKKLNAYRDSAFLLQTIPNLKLFRLTYRLLRLWATRRGIFSARFGYLGGIHLVFLLSHVFKSIAADQAMNLTACEVLKVFFEHYATFKYEENTIDDPDFSPFSKCRRTASREPLVISTIHSPTINVANTASQHSLQTLRDQILLANQKLDKECSWDEVTGGTNGGAERQFLNAFANFVKIDVRYWGRKTARGRSLIGWIESRCVHLLVELNAKVPNMYARIWPGRFIHVDEPHANEELNAFYLIGLVITSSSLRSSPDQGLEEAQAVNEQKKRIYNKFMDILRSFEEYLREEEKKYEVTESYISVTRVSRRSLGEGVRIDSQTWWDEDYAEVGANTECRYSYDPNGSEDDKDSLDEDDSASDSGDVEERSRSLEEARAMDDFVNTDHKNPQELLKSTSRSQYKREHRHNHATDEIVTLKPTQEYIKKAKLRPAHDIINRIKWDSDMDTHDYIIGYEDRFLGILQMNLEKWVGHRRDETDEEWMPMHRVVWITRASDSKVVWHREKRIDIIFGSGDRGESGNT